MSKKMMKRTAALSAMIAVALSGTVMAANVTDKEEFVGKITAPVLEGTGEETIYIIGDPISSNNPSVVDGTVVKTLDNVIFKGDWGTGAGGAVNAVQAGSASIVEFSNIGNIGYEGKITASGSDSTVLFHAYGGTIKIDNIETIKLDYGGSAFYANDYNGHDGKVIVTNVGTIEASSAFAVSYGSGGDAKVDITADNITLNSPGRAIYVKDGNNSDDTSVKITANEKLEINGTGLAKAGDGNTYDYGVICTYYGVEDDAVVLNGKEVSITNTEGGTAINAYGSSVAIGETSEKVDIKGHVYSDSGSDVSLDLGKEGSLEGAIMTDASSTSSLTLGEGSDWTTEYDSTVTNLTVNDGNVEMNGDGQTITVDNFTGEGATITTNSLNNQFNAASSTAEGTTIKAGEKLAQTLETADDATAETLYNDLLATVSSNVDVTELAFEETGVLGEGTVAVTSTTDANGNTTYSFGNLITKESTVNGGFVDMSALSFMAWRGENDDLNERLGDLRNAKEDRGIWTRMSRAQQKYGSATNQYSMYQIGYDQQAGDWTVGAAYSYTDGEASFAKGNSENKHNVFSLYGTKMNDNGSFVDVVAKYGNLDYDYTLTGGVGDGAYDTDAYSFGVEAGKRITSSNGVWVEPQVQLTYGMVDDVAFKTKQGYKVNLDSADSFVARAGIMAGKPVHKGNIYLKASYLYDFAGEVDASFSNGTRNTNISRDLGGGWWEVGAGANFGLSDVTYMYFDFEKAFGGEVDVEWKWNAGVRYSF